MALVIEDDQAMRSVLRFLLEDNGFRVVLAPTAERGQQDAKIHRPDGVIVDLGLPDRDGLTVITAIRAWSTVPIIVLSARTEEAQLLAAFEQGADDYVVKPFSPAQLMARVRAILRRHVRGELPGGLLQLGNVAVDMSRRVARDAGGREIHLTPLEHRILATLARHAERIVTHSALMKEVWGPDCHDSRGLRVYIASLRKKLESDPSRPKFIRTEPAVGYRLVLDPEGTTADSPEPAALG